MERLGIRPKRLQLEWVSAIEEQRWQEVMRRMEEVRILGNAVLPGPTLVAIDVHLIRPEFVP